MSCCVCAAAGGGEQANARRFREKQLPFPIGDQCYKGNNQSLCCDCAAAGGPHQADAGRGSRGSVGHAHPHAGNAAGVPGRRRGGDSRLCLAGCEWLYEEALALSTIQMQGRAYKLHLHGCQHLHDLLWPTPKDRDVTESFRQCQAGMSVGLCIGLSFTKAASEGCLVHSHARAA